MVRSRYARGAVEVRSWCSLGARYARTVLVRSARFINFSTGDTVAVGSHNLVKPHASRVFLVVQIHQDCW